MGLDRRTFLQQAGLGLLTLGVSQTGLSFLNFDQKINSKLNRYTHALAEPTPRKLALLVGINEYIEGENLKGCITDVELQQELLINRFGFQPEDILTLTGREATREAIERAFEEHLTQQVQSSDVVVFHFSGYGTEVKLTANPQAKFEVINSFIPSDGILPTEKTPLINGLLFETLVLLGKTLATDKVTLILDTSYHNAGKLLQGNLRTRSFSLSSEKPSSEEMAFQEQLKQKTENKDSSFNGVILSAAKSKSHATEIQGSNWSAGLFTYALTQYLWEVTPASKLIIAISKTTEQVQQIVGSRQVPILNSKNQQNRLAYNVIPKTLIGAEGVLTKITKLDNKSTTAQVKLTGLPPTVVHHYGLNSRFKLVAPQQLQPSNKIQASLVVQLTAREGLTATVQLLDKTEKSDFPLEVGQHIQEWIRVLPRSVGLVVALDQTLEKIERVDATSAFSGLGIISPVINAGDNFADCLFTRVNLLKQPVLSDETEKSTANLGLSPEAKGYELLWPGGGRIPHTVGKANEAVKSAIQRLTPQLKTLLAAKLWRLTINEGSSWLRVSATLEKIAPTPQPLIYRQTRQVALSNCENEYSGNFLSNQPGCPQGIPPFLISPSSSTDSQDVEALPKLSIGTPIQYRLQNFSDRPIYCLLFALDAGGTAITLYSRQVGQSITEQDNSETLTQPVIEPGKSLIIPQPLSDLYWKVSEPQGLVEVLLVCSVEPFNKTLQALAAQQISRSQQEQILTLPNPLEVAQALLQDLHIASGVKMNANGTSSDTYALDVNLWATLSFIYQVVE